MRRFLLALVVLLAGLGLWRHHPVKAVPTNEVDFFQHIDGEWVRNPYWFDGKAELNFYNATIIKYGQPRRTGEIVHILVSEKHNPKLLVKADDWRQPGLVNMLKFNHVISVQTGIYTYRQMMSLFFNQANARVAKMTFTSHEWCGNSFKEIINFRGRSRFDFNTYWDGQGSGEFEVSFPEDLVLYDALPVQLRMLTFEPGLSTRMNLLRTQISSRVSEPKIGKATVTVDKTEEVVVPAGTFDAVRVIVRHSQGVDRFWFETQFPNRMLRWQSFGGDRYELRSSKKLAYWQLNNPGDERYLE